MAETEPRGGGGATVAPGGGGAVPAGPALGTLLGGLALVALGALLLLAELGVADLGALAGKLWPLVLVAVGVRRLFDPDRRGGGIWLTAAGLWLLVPSFGLFGLGFRESWPLLLVFGGLGMVIAALLGPREAGDGRP